MSSQSKSNGVATGLSSLAQLGQAIKDNAERIETHLRQNDLPDPTFNFGAPILLDLPPELEGTRQALFDDIEHLTALLRGPLGYVVHGSNPVAFHYSIILSAISRFGIANHVPIDGSPIAISALAKACHMETSDLSPLLHAAIANRTFEAVGDEAVKHNAPSAAIALMPDLQHWFTFSRKDFTPAAFGLPEAMAKWPGASSPAHTGFAFASPTSMAMFDAIRNDPVRSEYFAGSMRLLNANLASEVPRVADTLALDVLPEGATIVDIGGSMGEVMTSVLRRWTHVKGVVQDLPHVIAAAQAPDDLKSRLNFQVADLFEKQPEKGADIYFMRKILHDWSDEYAQKILRGLIPALKPGAKIVLNEMSVAPPGSIHPRRAQLENGWSLAMKWLLNGKERSEVEWIALFTAADERFKFSGIRPVPAAMSSLIEFTWEQ